MAVKRGSSGTGPFKCGYGPVIALAVLCVSACAGPVDADVSPPATRISRINSTATAIPTLVVAPAPPRVTLMPPATLKTTATQEPACSPATVPNGMHISASGSYTETEDQAA